jgi:hypothetical protein
MIDIPLGANTISSEMLKEVLGMLLSNRSCLYKYEYSYTANTLHYTTLHYTTLHYTTLHYTTQHYTTHAFP